MGFLFHCGIKPNNRVQQREIVDRIKMLNLGFHYVILHLIVKVIIQLPSIAIWLIFQHIGLSAPRSVTILKQIDYCRCDIKISTHETFNVTILILRYVRLKFGGFYSALILMRLAGYISCTLRNRRNTHYFIAFWVLVLSYDLPTLQVGIFDLSVFSYW